jgi:hypothetical protein
LSERSHHCVDDLCDWGLLLFLACVLKSPAIRLIHVRRPWVACLFSNVNVTYVAFFLKHQFLTYRFASIKAVVITCDFTSQRDWNLYIRM